MAGGALAITDCVLVGNTAAVYGGGIRAHAHAAQRHAAPQPAKGLSCLNGKSLSDRRGGPAGHDVRWRVQLGASSAAAAAGQGRGPGATPPRRRRGGMRRR